MLERHDTILRALRIIEQKGGWISAFDFGCAMWPASPNIKREPGKVAKAGGGMLGRLMRGGLLQRHARGIYALTDEGRRYLATDGGRAAVAATPASPPAATFAAPQQQQPPTAPAASPPTDPMAMMLQIFQLFQQMQAIAQQRSQ